MIYGARVTQEKYDTYGILQYTTIINIHVLDVYHG